MEQGFNIESIVADYLRIPVYVIQQGRSLVEARDSLSLSAVLVATVCFEIAHEELDDEEFSEFCEKLNKLKMSPKDGKIDPEFRFNLAVDVIRLTMSALSRYERVHVFRPGEYSEEEMSEYEMSEYEEIDEAMEDDVQPDEAEP